jgi:outer membrane receptor protein involved in Fe transport
VVDPESVFMEAISAASRIACLVVTLVLCPPASAQRATANELTGTVTDSSGAPVPEARVNLRDAQQITVSATETDAQGRFRLAGFTSGSFVLTVSKAYFAEQREALRFDRNGEIRGVNVVLQVNPVATEVTVTAETNQVETIDNVAQRVNIVAREDIEHRAPTTLAEVAQEEVGVNMQRTSPVMGGFFVRGLTGKGVAVYRDGVRYTTSAQRGGVSTFLNLIEMSQLESVEFLRGPNSAQYGSDSLGGTVQLLSRAPILASGGPRLRGEIAPYFYSAAAGFGGHTTLNLSSGRFGAMTNLAARRMNTVRTGQGLDSHAAVTRFFGIPSDVVGSRLPDTAFTQYGGMVHAQYALTDTQQLIGHYERSQQDGGKRYDQLLGGDGNLVADLRNLMLDFGYLRFSSFRTGPLDQVSVTTSYNTQREERVNQGGQGNPNASITHQYERTKVWGLNAIATKHGHGHDLLLGAEGYHERVVAPAYTFSPSSGAVTFSRPRIPEGARYLQYGVYAQNSWDVLRNGKLRLSGALRFGGASYKSQARYSPLVGGRPLWPNDSLATDAVTGRIGAVFALANPVRLHAQYSRGFRSPNITDLGTIGVQGNGFYETSYADLAGRGATIGTRADDRAISTGLPVQPVRPEKSGNYEAGVLLRTSRVSADVNLFLFDLSDVIISQTLILPPGAVGQFLGDQPIVQQLATGAVYVPLAANPVLVRSNYTSARSYGLEQTLEFRITRSVLFAENTTYIYMKDKDTGLPPDIEGGTPPWTTYMRLQYSPGAQRWWGEVYGTLADRQERLSSLSLADRRIGATRSRTNIANFFNNGARVRGLVSPGADARFGTGDDTLVATRETLAQVQTRVLGTASSAPLFTEIPGYAVFGLRGGYHLTERSDLFLDFANLLDRNYRGLSWGMDGPGRAIMVRFKYRF